MKKPLNLRPITVPSVAVTRRDHDGEIINVFVGGLATSNGPAAFLGRHASLVLTYSQAECLLYDLAAKLDRTVS